MALITESNFDIIIESANSDKDFYISGIFSTADVKNKNGRIYPKPILEREIKKLLDESIKNKCCWGEIEHPLNRAIPSLKEAAILVESLDWHGNDVVGKAIVLDTPNGELLKSIMKKGRVGISSRGVGTVSESGLVESNFSLYTWDVVSSASNFNSKFVNGIYESELFMTQEELNKINKQKNIEDKKILVKEAQEKYKKHIFQVLDNISKNI